MKNVKNKTTLILGYGVASNAYASLIDNQGLKGIILGSPVDNIRINNLKKNQKKINKKIHFSKNIKFLNSNEIKKIDFNDINLIIIGTNTRGINWVIKILKNVEKNILVLIITKGLISYKKKIITISQYLKLRTKIKNVVMSAGPCLANELLNKVHTRTVFSSNKISNSKKIKNILENKYYHPDTNNDLIGSEVCSAIKNIYSIIIGSTLVENKKNKKFIFNTSAGIFQQSLKEMNFIVKKFGGRTDSVLGLAGSGDLYVSILGGRNSQLGNYLGKGLLYKNIINNKMVNITVEGADLIISLGKRIVTKFGKKNLPLLNSLCNAILFNKRLYLDWKQFIN